MGKGKKRKEKNGETLGFMVCSMIFHEIKSLEFMA
jgi:hypothetical protein